MNRTPSLLVVLVSAVLVAAASTARAGERDGLTLERSVRKDGTSDLRVEARLPLRWESRLGMRVGVPGDAVLDDYATTIIPWQPEGRASTVAWGTVTVPGPAGVLGWDRTTIDARLDPITEEVRVAGSLVRRWVLGDALSASLQGSLTVVESGLGQAQGSTNWETARSARLDIGRTGTALIARGNWSTSDPQWHGALVAEQALPGGARVSTSLQEIETGEPVLRFGAGFHRRW